MKIGTTLSVNDSQDTPKEWLKMVEDGCEQV